MVSTISAPATTAATGTREPKRKRHSPYPLWFYLPGAIIFIVLFAVPTFASFYFSLTRWTLFDTEFIGLDNFSQFFAEPALRGSLVNTFIYAFLTSGAKVVLGLLLGLLLTSQIVARGYLRSVVFFPVLVSTIGIGITFKILMDPFDGMINQFLAVFGITGPAWLTDPSLALYSIALVGVPQEYYEAARVDGASKWQNFLHITIPLVMPATATVVLLSLIGGLRSF